MTISPTETLEKHINQNGVRPGPKKLEQFKLALALRDTPLLYSQDNMGDKAIAHVKIFDPCGSWTWYITEWNEGNECFGYVIAHENELGYINLDNLATTKGRIGIGMEIDVWFTPITLGEVKLKLAIASL